VPEDSSSPGANDSAGTGKKEKGGRRSGQQIKMTKSKSEFQKNKMKAFLEVESFIDKQAQWGSIAALSLL
jgi:hypothetical protein